MLAILLEVPLLPFTLFLETGGLVDHQHLMLLHISQSGHLLEILTSTPGTSHILHDVQNIIEVPILSRKAWHTELSSSHQI